jgi:hypothetical protein
MLKADHKRWARILLNTYENFLIKRNFSNFFITDELPETDKEKALIITPNHISWWDGFFIDYINNRYINRKFHILILEQELRKYPFFRKTGAFSINPGSIKGIKATFDYAGELLEDKNNLLVFYPQGVIEPFDKDPDIKGGLVQLLKGKRNISVLPAAFRIEYHNKKRPSVYFRAGEQLSSEIVSSDYNTYKEAFKENVNQLRCNIFSGKYTADLFTNKVQQ